MSPKIIGFDVREMWESFDETWSEARRETYLFRHDVEKTLSCDAMVWKSIFSMGIGSGEMSLKIPKWIGPNNSLWENLDELTSFVEENWKGSKEFWYIALTCESKEGSCYQPYFEPTIPSAIDDSWVFLGYDVAEGCCLSGLSNCGGLEGKNMAELRQYWSPFLNKFHLFDDELRAHDFKKFSNDRVKEHAPFLVCGMWLIPQKITVILRWT